MKYALLLMGHADDPACGDEGGANPEEFFAFDQEITAAGVVVSSFALEGPEHAVTVGADETGERVVSSGPFAEVQEFVGGNRDPISLQLTSILTMASTPSHSPSISITERHADSGMASRSLASESRHQPKRVLCAQQTVAKVHPCHGGVKSGQRLPTIDLVGGWSILRQPIRLARKSMLNPPLRSDRAPAA